MGLSLILSASSFRYSCIDGKSAHAALWNDHRAVGASRLRTGNYAVHNPKAQVRRAATVEDILTDRLVVEPLTRAMCSPVSDGAAAVLIASKKWLQKQSAGVRERVKL